MEAKEKTLAQLRCVVANPRCLIKIGQTEAQFLDDKSRNGDLEMKLMLRIPLIPRIQTLSIKSEDNSRAIKKTI